MNSEKQLDKLFASARKEEPRISYEDISKQFLATSGLGVLEILRSVINPLVKYKSMLAITTGTIILGSTLVLLNGGLVEKNQPANIQKEVAIIKEIEINPAIPHEEETFVLESANTSDVVLENPSEPLETHPVDITKHKPNVRDHKSRSTALLAERINQPLAKPTRKLEMPEIGIDKAATIVFHGDTLMNINCEELPMISDQEVKRLRQDLTQKVYDDHLISSKKSEIKIDLSRPYLSVNNLPLSPNQSDNYLEFLRDFDIVPCSERIIEITPDYIMIGKVTSKGFMGIFSGTLDTKDLKRKHKTDKKENESAYEGRTIKLKNTATAQEKLQFEDAIRSAGLQISTINFRGDDEKIKSVSMHLEHKQGLDWRLRATGFKILEFKFFITANGDLAKFSHRFNQEGAFSDPVAVDAKGSVSVKQTHEDF